ncbi:MAG: bifunctional UDP-N-acetylglucosamine diphosphorylase/glucosamine-1-phosphate N-acetyltransferase GlmU, partial [Pseudomonadota bacterium]
MSTAVVLLAAGRGSRMQSDLPKVLHKVAGAPLLLHAMTTLAALAPDRLIVVTGHGAEDVEAVARDQNPDVRVVHQAEQKGTGHAVAQARDALSDFSGDVLVVYGDAPFVTAETLGELTQARRTADLVVLGFEAADPTGYGRMITDDAGHLARIVEQSDATEAEKALRLCNSGVICADAGLLFDLLARVGTGNAKGEYYLTDTIALAREDGLRIGVTTCAEAETIGVNTRADLATAEAAFQSRARAQMMADGVTLTAPETVFLAHDTVIGRDTTVAPYVTFGPGVTVESGAEIRSFCHLEGCHISRGAQIGPYARLRPGAEVSDHARIGNFVEIKGAQIGEGAKVNHLAYVGDAEVGEGANIGAGAITCNYDGVFKHRTKIGAQAFVGSNTSLVAPIEIGGGAYVASGSVVTTNVPPEDLAIGRAKQVNKTGLGARLRARLTA